ncbi:hypothetical protein DRW03_17780 [Corallococcus sp. H22C18031201]|nr:hypothetical protein DRW03_17780 [Corallococcus sp. H22C18031201]
MSTRKNLVVITQGPELRDHDSRALAMVHGLERALPDVRLEWTVTQGRQLARVPQRDAWLTESTRDGGFPLLCNGDTDYPVTISGLPKPAGLSPGRQPLLEVHAKLPLDPTGIASAAAVLESVAEGTRAYWGHASPEGYGSEVSEQLCHSAHGLEHSLRGLPVLQVSRNLRSPEIPPYLGWLNYWSAAAVRAIGFPDPARDADLHSRAWRTASGGWVVPLTDAPLDYNDPSHVEALLRTYERFPEIGGRAAH